MKAILILCMSGILYGSPLSEIYKHSTFDRTEVSITESGDKYDFKAEYNADKTSKVRQCLDDNLRGPKDASFKNAEIDADMTLSDRSTFHIKSAQGELVIKFSKSKNSKEALAKFKKLYAALTKVIG